MNVPEEGGFVHWQPEYVTHYDKLKTIEHCRIMKPVFHNFTNNFTEKKLKY